jgi:hypothetical protein
MGDPQSDTTPRRWRPAALTLSLLAAVVVAAGLTRVIPAEYRPYNFAAVGALALFGAARLGLIPALVVTAAAMLASDLLLWRQNGFDPDYLPSPVVYTCLGLYAVLGRAYLRRTENPAAIGAVAVAGGLQFFLITNFFAWVGQARPYGYSLAGLIDCYTMALPFYRGTLLGDLIFSAVLFGTHAVLVRTLAPAERVVPVPVTEGERP